MKDRVIEIVAEVLGCSIDEVSTDSSLMNDLGADSLDVIEIVMNVESVFDVDISDKELERIYTVGDLLNTTKRLKEGLVTPRKFKTQTRKTTKKRVIKFVETTYDDGTISMRPRTRGFNDFELVGLLSYYHDLFKVSMMQRCNTNKIEK